MKEIVMESPENLGLVNYDNYGPLRDYPTSARIVVNTDDITMDTWEDYYLGVLNIFRDGIEQDIIKEKLITLQFGNTGMSCELFITDFFININMWYVIIFAGGEIKPYHLVCQDCLNSKDIKNFIDKYFILEYRDKLSFRLLNNIIDDGLCNWFLVNEFASYFSETLNLKDDIDLMKHVPRYRELLHTDLSDVPIGDVNKVALGLTKELMEIEKRARYILGYDHCMANSHRAGTTPMKQRKESHINIGPKPDGNGNVYSHSINKSYINGGVNDIADFFIDSALSRTAQILSHTNVGSSGHFARLLGLNNSGSFLSKTIDHCDTRTLVPFTIKTKRHLELYYDRFYRLDPNGQVRLINRGDDWLIGKTVYLYSPTTCNSNSHNDGICKRCYGLLSYINSTINVGKISAEILSRDLTQRMLSARHILEASIKKTEWSKGFENYFDMEYNYIVYRPNDNGKNGWLVIDPDTIEIENEEDYNDEDSAADDMKEHIPFFSIITDDQDEIVIRDQDNRDLYISNDLNKVIRRYSEPIDGKIYIPLEKIDEDVPLFYFRILNNELSRLLDNLMALINRKPVIERYNLPSLLQSFIDIVVEGGLDIMGIHCEVIISNQIHNTIDLFKPIDWSNPNAAYKMVTLGDALLNNPNPSVTLMYQYLAKTLYTPLTYRKHGPSFLDMFFMQHPQQFLNGTFAKSIHDDELPQKAPWFIKLDEEPKPEVKKLIDPPYKIII